MTLGPIPAAARVYGWLLRAYPAGYRRRYGDGMRATFLSEWSEVRNGSPAARAAFWLTAGLDAMRYGVAERRCARRRGVSMRSTFVVDWRDAFRSLRAAPVVTAAAVLSLALGIGANTALFSILNSLILKTLPVHEPSRLVVLDQGPWTNPIWEQIRDRRHEIFEDAFAWGKTRFDLSTEGATDYVPGQWASGGIFDTLGVRAAIGRTFTAADDARNGGPDGPVAVISHGFWQRRFGGAPDVVGRRIMINRLAVTIIGVTPENFLGLEVGRVADITVPIGALALIPGGSRSLDGRSTWWLEIMVRLKPGQTLKQAQDALRGLQPQVRATTVPQNWPATEQAAYLSTPSEFTLVSAATGESSLRTAYAKPLKTIMGVVGAVLLIACANIANLLLARAAARRRELSLRLALGASCFRLGRQLLAESLLLAAAGAAAGLLIAQWGSALLVGQLATGTNGVTLDLSLDWRVLSFTAAVAVATAVVFGLAPAMGVSRIAPNEALQTDSRTVAGDSGFTLRNLLVVGQVALSLSLVVGAALFLRTLSALVSTPLGFDAESLITASVQAPAAIPPAARQAFFERIRESAQAIPGAAGASLSASTPAGASANWNARIEPAPGTPAPPGKEIAPWVNVVSPGWFTTFGMRIVAGRDISLRDVQSTPRVVIVNESFVRHFFPARNPIGQQVRAATAGPDVQSFEVVGVVSDSVYRSPRKGFEPTLFLPRAQLEAPPSAAILTVRAAAGRPEALTRALAEAIGRVDHSAAFTIQFPAAQLGSSVAQERLVALLGGFFGGLALLLAGLGLYGVTSYSVRRRRAEIGIRIALGADPSGVVRLIMRRVGGILAIGVAAGAALSWWASKFVASLLFGLGPRDPLAFASAGAVLILVGGAAAWLPAMRAARIEPVRALREH